jgi:hypothetical protein
VLGGESRQLSSERLTSSSWLFDSLSSLSGRLSRSGNWLLLLGVWLELLFLALEEANDVAGRTARSGAALARLLGLVGGLGGGLGIDALLWSCFGGLGSAGGSDNCSNGLYQREVQVSGRVASKISLPNAVGLQKIHTEFGKCLFVSFAVDNLVLLGLGLLGDLLHCGDPAVTLILECLELMLLAVDLEREFVGAGGFDVLGIGLS